MHALEPSHDELCSSVLHCVTHSVMSSIHRVYVAHMDSQLTSYGDLHYDGVHTRPGDNASSDQDMDTAGHGSGKYPILTHRSHVFSCALFQADHQPILLRRGFDLPFPVDTFRIIRSRQLSKIIGIDTFVYQFEIRCSSRGGKTILDKTP